MYTPPPHERPGDGDVDRAIADVAKASQRRDLAVGTFGVGFGLIGVAVGLALCLVGVVQMGVFVLLAAVSLAGFGVQRLRGRATTIATPPGRF